MLSRALLLPIALLAPLAACHKAPAPPAQNDGPIPAKVCADTKKSLDSLSAQGGMDITDKGEATVEQAIWRAMVPDQRDSLATALAFRAGCASGHQSKEQEVTIRSEEGLVLAHRFISTRTDLPSVLEGDR
jgi:hypothetical protein